MTCKGLRPEFVGMWKDTVHPLPVGEHPGFPFIASSAQAVTTTDDYNVYSTCPVEPPPGGANAHIDRRHIQTPHILTADVTGMYTNIPHQDLWQRIQGLLEDAWQRKGPRFAYVKFHRTYRWLDIMPLIGPSFLSTQDKCDVDIISFQEALRMLYHCVHDAAFC